MKPTTVERLMKEMHVSGGPDRDVRKADDVNVDVEAERDDTARVRGDVEVQTGGLNVDVEREGESAGARDPAADEEEEGEGGVPA